VAGEKIKKSVSEEDGEVINKHYPTSRSIGIGVGVENMGMS